MIPLKEIPEWWDFCELYRYDLYRFAFECIGMNPTWQQELLFESIVFDGSKTSVASGHGCFAKGTPIKLFDGTIKPIEKVKFNDKLMGHDGTKREILELIKGKEELYKLKLSNELEYTFNYSHILCLTAFYSGNGWEKGDLIEVPLKHWLNWSDKQKNQFGFYKIDENNKYLGLKIISYESLGVGKYYGFVLFENPLFLSGDDVVFHNTGKTSSAGIVALWHLLCFEQSIMMFTAPQIGQLKKQVWKEISLSLEKLKNSRFKWLADYVGFQSEMVYIKGFKENWHIFAKTAPKHQATNIAGNHGDNYMVWGDEACGIADAVMDVVLGALTHDDNRVVLTSQPATSSGTFYDTHHRLSHKIGGAWTSLTFNGEESPIVSKKSIREQLEKYGSRDDPQYKIRVLGQFPERLDEFLLTTRQIEGAYQKDAFIDDEHQKFGYVITVDVGGGVGRDDSVIAVSKVWGEAQWGERARRVEVVDIPICKNRDDITELFGIISECINTYSNAILVVDDLGAGKGLGQLLKKNGFWYIPVYWGGACFNQDNRKEYANKRAQAYVCLTRAVTQGRFKMKTNKYAVKFKEQIIHIPYVFDEQSRYKVLSKDEMKKMGIKSPDLGDAMAFLFLENVHYTEAEEHTDMYDENSMQGKVKAARKSKFDELKEAAKNKKN